LALSASVLTAAAALSPHLSVLAWIAIVPLLLALKDGSAFSSFCLGWFAGSLAYAGIAYWVTISPVFTTGEALVIPGYLGLHWGLFGATLAVVRSRSAVPLVIAAPILWVVCEYFRSTVLPLDLPWILLGHTQSQSVALIQMAAVTGVYGVSYLIILVNSLIVEAMRGVRNPVWSAVVAILVMGLAVVSGQIVMASAVSTQTISVTVVPGNIAQDIKWDQTHQEENFRRYMQGSIQAVEASKTALVIWPETSVPGPLNRDVQTLEILQRFTRQTGSTLLVGSAEREKFGQGTPDTARRYNSAFLFTPSSVRASVYHKIHLFPFGEYLPLEKNFPWPERYRTHSSHFAPGEDYSTFTLSVGDDAIPFSVVICWEGIFPNLVRQFVQHGAAFLVGISNEAWFDGAAATQFLAMNTFRAVENRRTLVRAVNGGMSGFIDPYGRLVASMTPDQDDDSSGRFLTHPISIVRKSTFYTLYGDVFAQAMTATACVLLLVPFRKRQLLDAAHVPGFVHAEDLGDRRSSGLGSDVIEQRKVART
jgi:apolipoprotein N-acyltransferase